MFTPVFDKPQQYSVSEQMAVEQAVSFLKNINLHTRGYVESGNTNVESVYPWLTRDIYCSTRAAGVANLPDTLLYIVNFSEGSGYALVSLVTDEAQVVAYVEDGNLTPDAPIENPGFRNYLDDLGSYLGVPEIPDTADTDNPQPFHPDGPLDPLHPETSPHIEAVYSPLLSTKWGDLSPFNIFCLNAQGYTCSAGCLSVALGQIFAFYQFPNEYNNHQYIWSAILSDSVPVNNVGIINAALLIRDIGDITQANYAPYYTTFSETAIPSAFLGFNYSTTVGPYNLYACLNNIISGKPVLAIGHTSSGLGSAWVIDGALVWNRDIWVFDGTNNVALCDYYVHCNWGWYGTHNGYFLSGVFNLSQRAFDDNAEAVTDNNAGDIDYGVNNMIYYNITPSIIN